MMRVVVAIFAVWACITTAAAQDCRLKQYGSITLKPVKPDHLLIPVQFGSHAEDMVFRLDSAQSLISSDVAEELNLQTTRLPDGLSPTRGGQPIQRIAHVSDFHLGPIPLAKTEFLIMGPHEFKDAVGEIGTNTLGNADFELNIAGAKLNLFSQNHCPGKVVYWTDGPAAHIPFDLQKYGSIRVPIMLDGKQIVFALSTTGHSVIGMSTMRRIFNLDENSPGMKLLATQSNGHKIYTYPFKTLAAEGLNIDNPDILVSDGLDGQACDGKTHMVTTGSSGTARDLVPSNCSGGMEGQLALRELSKLRLYFATKEKMLYLTAAKPD